MYLGEVKHILGAVLGLGQRSADYDADTPLLGEVPELDSQAVVALITALEQQFGIEVQDDEIGAATFATVGSLARFVEAKLA